MVGFEAIGQIQHDVVAVLVHSHPRARVLGADRQRVASSLPITREIGGSVSSDGHSEVLAARCIQTLQSERIHSIHRDHRVRARPRSATQNGRRLQIFQLHSHSVAGIRGEAFVVIRPHRLHGARGKLTRIISAAIDLDGVEIIADRWRQRLARRLQQSAATAATAGHLHQRELRIPAGERVVAGNVRLILQHIHFTRKARHVRTARDQAHSLRARRTKVTLHRRQHTLSRIVAHKVGRRLIHRVTAQKGAKCKLKQIVLFVTALAHCGAVRKVTNFKLCNRRNCRRFRSLLQVGKGDMLEMLKTSQSKEAT